ncbi:endolytic transglycosylase MltG [Eudoraea chungangensis]|uniref:endolytic transglycosylase MltG n=1 Tax=Eudoraea chungangensis TaxID=1481905 RepID=UPI0023EDFA91|nr:endolytic transglycosylase MltG [Eudoraea chungangensis]
MYIKRILLAIVLVGLVIAGVFAYLIYDALLTPNTSFENKEEVVFIPTNTSFAELIPILRPLLVDIDNFALVARQKKYDQRVRGGKYVLKNGMSNNDIVNTLRSNNIPVNVSFNNQETVEKLAGRIASQIEADSLSILKSITEKSFLETNGFNLETALSMYIPNSYEFFWNTSANNFRDRMLKEYKTFWNKERLDNAKEVGLSPKEVIALAAIVQKETAKVDERPRVAGLYLNRLKSNMLLQADPTVIYAIKKESGNYDTIIKRVLYKDLELKSPYNTYKYSGLPPGPITMPDISSIDAVLRPENHEYYYMVVNVKDFGYHMFAKSLTQHNRNKEQYIRWINEQKIMR